jgi:phage terminase large subunit-like protein
MALASRASWITEAFLRRQAEDPELIDAQVLQLHGCVWAATESTWVVGPAAWAACADRDRVKEEDERITVGFDGSYRRDSTCLVGCTLDGHLFVLGAWERPERAPADWKVPRAEVDAAVADAMERFDVVELACDPPGWHAEIDGWQETYGGVVEFPTNERRRMAAACDRLRAAVLEGDVTHDGDALLARHVGHCVARQSPYGMLVGKDHTDSPRKIDAAVAAIVAFERAAWHAANVVAPWIGWGTR